MSTFLEACIEGFSRPDCQYGFIVCSNMSYNVRECEFKVLPHIFTKCGNITEGTRDMSTSYKIAYCTNCGQDFKRVKFVSTGLSSYRKSELLDQIRGRI